MSAAEVTGVSYPKRLPRIAGLDLVRGIAIIGMVVYHTAFDLFGEGLIATDVENGFLWRSFAHLVAGTFLLVVGISLELGTHDGIDWQRYLRRVALIAGGALLVTIATFVFDPSTFVYFGILHEIALASLLALPFLIAPAWLVAVVAAAVVAAPWLLSAAWFNQPALLWIGLATEPRATLDYVPLLPWFGLVLAGLLAGRAVVRHAARLAAWRPVNAPARLLATAGRWSLVIYLVHQPLIFGAVYLIALARGR